MTNNDSKPCHVVFGATGGIGSALSRMLAHSGSKLVLAARDTDRLNTLARELDATACPTDATQFDAVQACIDQAIQTYGRIDGIANSVGSLLLKPAHSTSENEWHATIAANLTSAFAVVRAGTKAMTQSGNPGGSIALVSSAAARIGLANHEAIAAAKAGVIGLTLSAAATYAPRGIRINCIAPGLVRTPMTKRLTDNEASLKVSTAMHALGRIGEPDDVARSLQWLLDPEQRWVTGQVLGVDGGLGTLRSR